MYSNNNNKENSQKIRREKMKRNRNNVDQTHAKIRSTNEQVRRARENQVTHTQNYKNTKSYTHIIHIGSDKSMCADAEDLA